MLNDVPLVIGQREGMGEITVMRGGIDKADGAVVFCEIPVDDPRLIAQVDKLTAVGIREGKVMVDVVAVGDPP